MLSFFSFLMIIAKFERTKILLWNTGDLVERIGK